MSLQQLRLEFPDRTLLEKYTRQYLSTHFETIVKQKGDVVPKDFNYGKIADMNYEKLLSVLAHYKSIVNARETPKAKIATIKEYYDSSKLNVHHTFDRGSDDNYDFWFFIIIFVIIILLIIYYRRKQ